jgi:predicted PurR-regulated permease PerM
MGSGVGLFAIASLAVTSGLWWFTAWFLLLGEVRVLVVTALGGLLGGIVGLILAVPATVIASNAIARLRSRGIVERVAERAEPTVQKMLD